MIPIANFSHGRSRNLGARAAAGEIVVFLSQDALPADERWLSELLAPFADPGVAGAYSRQIPRPDANPMERHFLETRFPPGGPVARAGGAGELSLEQVFFSNVSSAVRREALLAHPFDEELIMSEDQQLSRDLLAAGFSLPAVLGGPALARLHARERLPLFPVAAITLWVIALVEATREALRVETPRAALICAIAALLSLLPLWAVVSLAATPAP